MRTKLLFLILILTLLAGAVITSAQQAPPQVNAALNDLSERLGIVPPLTVSDMDRWQWSQNVYTDSSLGCNAAIANAIEGTYSGYQFLLTYEGITYDYRVSEDQQIVILCNESDIPEIPAECAGDQFIEPRLQVGGQGRVETGGVPNNVRDQPGTSGSYLGEIPPGGVFTVLAGPRCTTQFVWWRVNYEGLEGWTVEGAEGDYWLEPLDAAGQPVAPPQPEQAPISPANIGLISEVPLQTGETGPLQAWSDDSTTLAVAATGNSQGVWLYDLTVENAPRRLLPTEQPVTSIAFNAGGTRIAVGTADGVINVYSVDTNTLQATLQAQDSAAPVTALAFSSDGLLLVTGDQNGIVRVWEPSVNAQRAVLQAHSSAVVSLSFSPDGVFLTSVGQDGSLRVWSASTAG